jgi:hypothetical protein
MPWKNNKWVDDDGSLTVGTPFDAEHMNNVEIGIAENHDGVAAASGVAGSALTNAASGVTAAGSALVTAQQANARAASGVTAAGSALVTGQGAGVLAGSALFTGQQANVAAGSALFTGQKANALAASGVAAAGSGVTGVTNLFNKLATAGEGVVLHGSNPNLQRPFGFDSVIWVGTVEPVNAAELDPWINPEDFGINSTTFVPACQVYKATGQSIPLGVFGELLFDTERYDNAGMHSTSSNTGRLVAPKTGIYLASLHVGIGTSLSNGIQEVIMAKNGGNWSGDRAGMEPNGEAQFVYTETIFLEAGDYITFLLYNNAASAKTTTSVGASGAQEASLTWLGTGTPSLTPVDWGLVTELPGGAGVGDKCQLKVRENESSPWKVWNCVKVEASGTRPWAAHGPPLYVPLTSEPEVTSATPVTAIEIAAPVAMEADIEFGASLVSVREAALSAGRMAIYKGATEIEWEAMGGSSTFDGGPMGRPTRTTLAKGEAALLKYRAEVEGKKVRFTRMFMSLSPVRVG